MSRGATPPSGGGQLFNSLLDEQHFSFRQVGTNEQIACTLPELFLAMAKDEVRDFPALRAHQRHPWHAFLTQLAAIALNHASRNTPFITAGEWRQALLSLTPDDPDGAAWCLVSPVDRPAFMQTPVPSKTISDWKNTTASVDELDMLVTSKNHDLKASRMARGRAEDWVYALVSLQTQEGFLGSGNYGISRMNGGFASRCGVGIHPNGAWGKRWLRDVSALLAARPDTVERFHLKATGGHALLWLLPWDGVSSLAFSSLDPWYIEICRRIRLTCETSIRAHAVGSKASRIEAKELSGVTGDPWMPVDTAAGKALTIGSRGFDYKLSAELLLGGKFSKPVSQQWLATDDKEGVFFVAQGVTRGQGKTEGFHERRIPISRKMRQAFLTKHTDELAKLANERIEVIAEVRKMLWSAMVVLLSNAQTDESGKDKDTAESIKDLAARFAQPFEVECDARFFDELMLEIESDSAEQARIDWLQSLADRATGVLNRAFESGPRSGQRKYRARSAAMARLQWAMRGSKLPALSRALQSRTAKTSEVHHAAE